MSDFLIIGDRDEDLNKPIRSWSQFSMYMRCPSLYEATYIEKTLPRSQNVNMFLGSTVHHAHEMMAKERKYTGKTLDLATTKRYAIEYWEEGISGVGEDNITTVALNRSTMLKALEVYHSFFAKSDIQPKHIEETIIWYPKGYPFAVKGIIDRIDKGGKVVDLKTAGKSPPKNRRTHEYYIQSKSGYDLQLDIYILLAREGLDIDVSSAGLEVVVKTKCPKVVEVTHQVNEDRLKSVLDLMANLDDSIQSGNFPKNRLYDFCHPKYCSNWGPCTGLPVFEV